MMLLPKLLSDIRSGRKVIYMDETIFKPYQVTGKSWAIKGDNQALGKMGSRLETLAVIVGISYQRGLEGYLVKAFSIKKYDII